MAKSTRNGKTAEGPVRLALITAPGTMAHIGRTVRHMAIGLLDEPMSLTVVAPESQDVGDLPSPPMEVLTYPVPRFGRHGRRAIETVAAGLVRRNVELLHCLDGRGHGLTRRLSDLGGWPYFVSVQALRECHRLRPLGEHCCGVVAASLALREALLSERVAGADRVHLVRPGVRVATATNSFAERSGCTAIVAAGRLDDFDAFSRVLDSFAAIRAADYDCILFILGNGSAEMRLRRRVKDLKLTHDVTFVEQMDQQDLPGIFRAADVMVYPAASGSLEIEILEAMAAGVAILVGVPVVGDFVIDPETAISYDGSRADDLTARLRVLLDDPDVAIQLASRAQQHVRTHHSPASMVAALADLYRRIALRGRTLRVS